METKLKQEPVADGLRFVDQTRFGYPDGNCFAACVAAILSLPLADMPTVSVVKDFDCTWREWLKRRGLGMVDVPSGTGEHIAGYCIAFGDSPRGGFTISQHPVSHAVVCRDMELVHDPHPSRAFLDGTPKGYTVFYNLNSEPVADGGGMEPEVTDDEIRHCHRLRLQLASSQEALRAARGLIEEYRESHINSRRPCVDDTLGGISTSTDSRCSTCKEADSLLSPEGSSQRHCDYKNCSLPHGHIQSCNELNSKPEGSSR